MTKPLYKTLGACESDDAETLKKHYRRRSKECHPDKYPGDPAKADEFKAVNEAFGVLINAERRAAYDKTGEVPPVNNDPRAPALAVLSKCLHSIITHDLKSGNKTSQRQLIEDLKNLLDQAIREIDQGLAKLKKSREAIADVADRITCNKGEDNVLAAMARAPLRGLDQAIAQGEQDLAAHKEAWAIGKKFKFRADAKSTTGVATGWSAFQWTGSSTT